MATPAADLRRRVMGWRAAERREQTLRAHEGPLSPAAALELHEIVCRTFGPAGCRPRPRGRRRACRLAEAPGDLARISGLVAEFGLALDEPGRLDALEQIIRRIGLS